MVKQFGVSKSTIIFKINIVKLIDKHSKIKNSLLSLHFLKNYFKMIKEVCEENSSEFEYLIGQKKVGLNFCQPYIFVSPNFYHTWKISSIRANE